MDRSGNNIPIMQKQFVKHLSQRSDSYWELIATAAGENNSVAKTLKGLSYEELERGGSGAACAPSIVRERVEAIAAFNSNFLAELASRWIRPQQIEGNPFWTAAWSASLRHLEHLGVITRRDVDVPELLSEIDVIWAKPQVQDISWQKKLPEFRSSHVPYEKIRRWAHCRLVEVSLSVHDLELAPIIMLRLLRGRESLLDTSAQRVIESWWRHVLDKDPFDAAVILEVCDRLQIGNEDKIRTELIRRLPTIEDPRTIIPLVYVLLDSGWTVP